AITQGTGDESGPRGGADEGEAREVETDGARRRALADDDVELEVLHGRVQDLFHRAAETVDLVDEEHVAVVEVGEKRGQITRPLERRARGHAEPHTQLRRHDAGEGGFSQARWSREEQMVDGLAPAAGCLQEDVEVLAQLGL